MDSYGGCMPEEILFDILTMLPVKSLCRFRCVSKSWFSIISNPNFVAAHLARFRSRPKLLISVNYVDPRRLKLKCAFFSVDYPHVEDMNKQPLALRATSCSSSDFTYTSMISPSPTGLICFTCSDGIKIGNPITGNFDVLPYPISEMDNKSLFFGFDPVESSHVILKLEEHDYTTKVNSGRSSVFDLVEYYWHLTQPHPWLSGGDSAICIDGVIYFTALAEFNRPAHQDDCLFAFDIGSKSFEMIEHPDLLDLSFAPLVELLIEYKGHLAFVFYGDARDTTVDGICLWILDDQKKHIWSFKSYVVLWRENLSRDGISIDGLASYSPGPGFPGGHKVKLFGATDRGELILATSLYRGSFYLFFYQKETNSLRRFEVYGLEVDEFGRALCGEARFTFVTESLQSPKGLRRRRKQVDFISLHPPCS